MLTDDGSSLTVELAQTLHQRGWQVVVMSWFNPDQAQSDKAPSNLPAEIRRVAIEDWSETHLQQQLQAIATQYGSIAALIHLHPQYHNSQQEHRMLKQVFFLAKHLKASLNQSATAGRSCWITVAHLDGELGTSGHNLYQDHVQVADNRYGVARFNPVAGGLFGLTKALHWEWEAVFCRALDLCPDLDATTSVAYILAELHDPNRLITEVGYRNSRTTLVC